MKEAWPQGPGAGPVKEVWPQGPGPVKEAWPQSPGRRGLRVRGAGYEGGVAQT